MVTRVAVTTGAPASAAAFAPTLPTHANGDRLVLVVVGKYDTTTVPTINQGWTLVGSGTGGTGSAANDTGTTFWAVYAKNAASGSETAPTVTPGATAPNSWEWICASHRPAAGDQWKDTIAASAPWVRAATDATTATPLTGTATSWGAGNFPTAGDAIFTVGAIPTDLGTALGATTVTNTGLSGGTVTSATSQYVENALNADSAAVWAGWTGFTGTASAGTAMSFAVTGASNLSGSLVAIALREELIPLVPPANGAIKWFDGADDWDSAAGTTRAITIAVTAGDPIVVCTGAENGDPTNNIPTAIANDGAALTWTMEEELSVSAVQGALRMWSATADTTRTIVVTLSGRASTADAAGAGAWVAGGASGIGVSNLAHNSTSSGPSAVTLAGVAANSSIVGLNVDWNATAGARTYNTATAGTAVENRYDGTAGANYIAEAFHHINAGSSGSKTVGVSVPSTQRYVIAAVEITWAGGGVTGAAALAGIGSTTAAGVVDRNSGSTLAGTGAVTATGVVGKESGATLTGTGTVTASGVVGMVSGSTLAGTGTITATGSSIIGSAAALAGTGTITATGAVATTGAAALAGTGTVATTGVVGTAGAALLAGTGTITAAGATGAVAAAALTGTGALSAAGVVGTVSTASLTGTGTLIASGVAASASGATLAGTGQTTAAGLVGTFGGASLAGTGTVVATGVVGRASAATLAGTGTIAATGATVAPGEGTANLQGTGTIVATGVVARSTTASLTGTGAVTATSTVTMVTAAALAGTGTVVAEGVVGVVAVTTLTATATIVASGVVGKSSVATLAGTIQTVAVGVAGEPESITGDAALVGTGLVVATGRVDVIGSAVLNGVGSIVAVGALDLVEAPVLVDPVARIEPNTARATIEPGARGVLEPNTARGTIVTESDGHHSQPRTTARIQP